MNVSKYVGPTFIIYAIVCINNIAIAQTVAANNAKASIIKYEKYIDENNDKHLKEFSELIAIPSISSSPANKTEVVKTAAWLVNKLNSIGMSNAKQLATEGNPVVFASWDKAPGKPTILIYGQTFH